MNLNEFYCVPLCMAGWYTRMLVFLNILFDIESRNFVDWNLKKKKFGSNNTAVSKPSTVASQLSSFLSKMSFAPLKAKIRTLNKNTSKNGDEWDSNIRCFCCCYWSKLYFDKCTAAKGKEERWSRSPVCDAISLSTFNYLLIDTSKMRPIIILGFVPNLHF